ncbi:MAG: thioredoxin family protein [Nanoarchaeota archaeon]
MSNKKHRKKQKMSPVSIVVMIFLGGLLIYSAVSVIRGGSSAGYDSTVNMDALSTCIVENDVTFYGTEWCSHCATQKRMLGDVYSQFKDEFYVDCDAEPEACQAAGIRGYPTWVIEGQQYVGMQELETLMQAAGCQQDA